MDNLANTCLYLEQPVSHYMSQCFTHGETFIFIFSSTIRDILLFPTDRDVLNCKEDGRADGPFGDHWSGFFLSLFKNVLLHCFGLFFYV